MFSWLWRRHKAKALEGTADAPREGGYQRFGTNIRVGFANAERSWEEEADLIEVLGSVLRGNGHTIAPHDDGLLHADSGIVLAPSMCDLQPIDGGGVRTTTLVETAHPAFGATRPFEYQHSGGDDVTRSLEGGFDQWRQVDLPVLLDALRETPVACTIMNMTFRETPQSPARTRRAVLGPIAHFRQHAPAGGAERGPDGEEHPFCPCCLLTNTFDAFKPLLESEGFYAIRFYAARDAEGQSQADCRVNGEDCEAGKVALLKYVAGWPAAGVEFRKQYVIVHTVASDQNRGAEVHPKGEARA